MAIAQIPADLKLVVSDVDGTLTDGGIYVMLSGDEFRKFNAKDGMAVRKLQRYHIEFALLSHSHTDKMVAMRANMLDLKYYYAGKRPKEEVLLEWITELGIEMHQVIYLGDDVNDMEVMKLSGLSACPADAALEIRAIADIVLKKNGGDGCLRELVDEHILKNRT